MEKDKKPLMFTNTTSSTKVDKKEPLPSKKSSRSAVVPQSIKPNASHVHHKLNNGVVVILVKDAEEDYSTIKTIQDVLELDKKKPNNIVGLNPPIYHEFIDRAKKTINLFVNEGDLVTVNRKFMDKKGDIPRRVEKVYIKSLNNMSVIVAQLDDKELCLTNRLIVCK
jgi:hypothetical protein